MFALRQTSLLGFKYLRACAVIDAGHYTISRPIVRMNSTVSNRISVRSDEDSDSMIISFKLSLDGKTKYFNLDRKRSDSLSSSIERIRLNVMKMRANKKSKKNQVVEDSERNDIKIVLYKDGLQIDPHDTKNADAWIDGARLQLGDQIFTIGINEPVVSHLRLPSPILSGFVILPLITVANCDIESCNFEWFRRISAKEKNEMFENHTVDPEKIVSEDNCYWLKVGDNFTYAPTHEDVAHVLKCICEPRSQDSKVGLPYWICSSGPVEVGPRMCPFEKRHAFTREKFLPGDDRIRFVTYNILADVYADTNYSRSFLFAHCAPHVLDVDYRRQLLFKELQGYNADIICLQEVDRKEFSRGYEPFFKISTDHIGIYHTKGGQVSEGLATFFRRSRFELIDSHRTVLNRLIDPFAKTEPTDQDGVVVESVTKAPGKKDEVSEPEPIQHIEYPHPILDDLNSMEAKNLLAQFDLLKSKIFSNPLLMKRFIGRHTILQTTLVKIKDENVDRFLMIANTHLYFAPDADHIRLLQGCVCVNYLEYIRKYYAKLIAEKFSLSEPKIDIIFCGDMNSSPDCGLYTLLQKGFVGKELKDWGSNESEKVSELSFSTNLRFSTAYRDIPYTNFTPGFNGCLDYIYYEINSLQLDRTIPLPDHEDVILTDGIPSEVFPSDHLALVADLKLKQ